MVFKNTSAVIENTANVITTTADTREVIHIITWACTSFSPFSLGWFLLRNAYSHQWFIFLIFGIINSFLDERLLRLNFFLFQGFFSVISGWQDARIFIFFECLLLQRRSFILEILLWFFLVLKCLQLVVFISLEVSVLLEQRQSSVLRVTHFIVSKCSFLIHVLTRLLFGLLLHWHLRR